MKHYLQLNTESILTPQDKLDLLIPMLNLLGWDVEIDETEGKTMMRVGPCDEAVEPKQEASA